jgi:hypothetical protein
MKNRLTPTTVMLALILPCTTAALAQGEAKSRARVEDSSCSDIAMNLPHSRKASLALS